jgi:hypothetical protein
MSDRKSGHALLCLVAFVGCYRLVALPRSLFSILTTMRRYAMIHTGYSDCPIVLWKSCPTCYGWLDIESTCRHEKYACQTCGRKQCLLHWPYPVKTEKEAIHFPKSAEMRTGKRCFVRSQEDALREVEDIHVRKGLPELRADWQT